VTAGGRCYTQVGMRPATAKDDWIEVPFRVLKEHEGARLDSFLAARLGKK
jgi:hypothetical protein